jgi:hypothetical protein
MAAGDAQNQTIFKIKPSLIIKATTARRIFPAMNKHAYNLETFYNEDAVSYYLLGA